jgi:hypothetical protein
MHWNIKNIQIKTAKIIIKIILIIPINFIIKGNNILPPNVNIGWCREE